MFENTPVGDTSLTAQEMINKFGTQLLSYVYPPDLIRDLRDHDGFTYTGEIRQAAPGEWYLGWSGVPRQAPQQLGGSLIGIIMRPTKAVVTLPRAFRFYKITLEEVWDEEKVFVLDSDGSLVLYDPFFDGENAPDPNHTYYAVEVQD